MSLVKRVQLLEKHFGTDTEPGAQAVIIYIEDASMKETEPLPITKFSHSGQDIHREPTGSYQDFETRALRAALELLPPRQPGVAAPAPVLIADGSLQQ